MVDNPVPPAALALILAVPGIWLAGRTMARLCLDDLWTARLAAPGFALAGWLLSVHVAGLLLGSFPVALWTGSIGFAAVGLIVHVVRPVRPPVAGWAPSRGMWAGAAIAVAVIAPLAFGWSFHDELLFTGHMSVTAAIQNGPYPPPNLSFPVFELRYHYAFDLLNAAFTSVTRLPIDVGMDVLTLLLWGWTFTLLWAAGERTFGRNRGWITAVAVSVAGGFPLLCAFGADNGTQVLVGACLIGGTLVNPPVVSYFFQHPWTIGLPLALVLGFVFAGPTDRKARHPALALLLVALALSQIVLFASLAAALVVADARDGQRLDPRRGFTMLVTSAAAVLVAVQLGGFFAPWPGSVRDSFILHIGIVDGLGASLVWHAASFGFLMPIGLYGLVRAPGGRVRTLLGCLVIGSLLVLNSVAYTQSWDIVKFGNVAMLGLAGGASVVVAWLLDRKRPVLAAGSLALVGLGGVAFVLMVGVRAPGIPGYLQGAPVTLGADDVAAAGWLRRNVEPGDVVYRAWPVDAGYAQWAGLPQAHLDHMAPRLGFPPDLIADRERVLWTVPERSESFLAQDIRWVVLGPEDTALESRVAEWVARGEAVERERFGSVRVVQLGSR